MQTKRDRVLLMLGDGRGRTRLQFQLRCMGDDFLGVLTGGIPHAGACALAWRDPKGRVKARRLTVPRHREAEVACTLALAVCRATRRSCLVAAGIHLEGIRRDEIRMVLGNVRRLRKRIARLFRTRRLLV